MNRIQVANDAQGSNALKELQDDGIDTSLMLVRIELRHVTVVSCSQSLLTACLILNVQVAEDGNTPFTYVIVDNQTLVFFTDTIFFRTTQYIGDTHNARTLIPMNRRTQTLPLGASSKTVPANPQD
jgi:hypothetical protein